MGGAGGERGRGGRVTILSKKETREFTDCVRVEICHMRSRMLHLNVNTSDFPSLIVNISPSMLLPRNLKLL